MGCPAVGVECGTDTLIEISRINFGAILPDRLVLLVIWRFSVNGQRTT
jgi:hypothetical protein